MAVQTGEGTIEIIFGSTSIPAGASVFGGYLARPDGRGEWPTVLIFGPEPLPTSSIKNFCRVLARHGLAALAPEMSDNHATNGFVATRTAGFVSNPAGHWSNAQLGFGVLAFGPGIYDASGLAAGDGMVVALASVGATLDDRVVSDLAVAQIPGLWIGSRADETVDVDRSLSAKETLPQTTFAIHSDVGERFWDDGVDGFDEAASADTFDRVVDFFAAELPPRL